MSTAVEKKEQAAPVVGPTMTRLGAWWSDVRTRIRKPRWYIPFFVTAGLWLLEQVAGDISVRVLGVITTFLGGLLSGLLARSAGVFGVAFFVVVVALVVRAFWETTPRKSKHGGHAWILEERLKLAESSEQVATAQIAEQQRQLAERDAQINQLNQALTVAQDERKVLFQRLEYGDPLIATPVLKDADNAIMVSRVEEMVPNITGMVKNGERVWHHLIGHIPTLSTTQAQEALSWLVTFIEENTVYHCMRSYKLLSELVGHHQDPRKGLACFYSRYCDWRRSIRRFADVMPHHLYQAPAYRDWFRNDTQFFTDLQQRLSTTPFAAVRAALREYNEGHEPVTPLPDPDRDP